MTALLLMRADAAPSAGDTAWVLVSAGLVMLMVPALAFFYGGLVRGKGTLNTMLMSLAALAVVTVQWVLVGYSLAFAPGRGALASVVGGLSWLGLAGVGGAPNAAYAATIPHLLFAVFQAMFAGITVAVISGAVVERMRFRAFLLFAVLWTTLVYDPLAHWVWGEGGWLKRLGALDFAGGTVVHVSAGVSALVASLVLGRRQGLGQRPPVPHNVPFTLLGAGLLWFGWLGFNGGSALAADGIAATAVATTHAAAAAALATWMLIEIVVAGRATAVGAATGAVVGLVAITPAAGFVTPGAALVIGALGAGASFAAIHLRHRTRVDDALDVFACHGVAGVFGALLTGVFATKAVNPNGADGLLAGNASLLGVQALAVLATMLFAGVLSAAILGLIRLVMPLRVGAADELDGIDLAEHGEDAYAGDIAELAGQGVGLGRRVYIPVAEAGALVGAPAPGPAADPARANG